MKHFQEDKWLEYKNENLKESERIEMEDHLYNCDKCMEIFLSTIEEEEITGAGAYISIDFTENIMRKVAKAVLTKERKKKRLINDFFLYYAAVASVAIILTAGGLFGKMVETVPKISLSIDKEENQIKPETIYNISEAITGKTSDFINNFGTKKIKED